MVVYCISMRIMYINCRNISVTNESCWSGESGNCRATKRIPSRSGWLRPHWVQKLLAPATGQFVVLWLMMLYVGLWELGWLCTFTHMPPPGQGGKYCIQTLLPCLVLQCMTCTILYSFPKSAMYIFFSANKVYAINSSYIQLTSAFLRVRHASERTGGKPR